MIKEIAANLPEWIKYIYYVIDAAVFIYPLKEIITNKDKTLMWWQRISKFGWWLIIIGFLLILKEMMQEAKHDLTEDAQAQKIINADSSQASQTRKETINAINKSLAEKNINVSYNRISNSYQITTIKTFVSTPAFPDELNYKVSYNGNDSLFISPLYQSWVKPFFGFDNYLGGKNENIYSDQDYIKYNQPLFFKGKKHQIILIYTELPVTSSQPIGINISGDKHQYIVFGDGADENKRYVYKDGVVDWIPIKNISQSLQPYQNRDAK
jgi:hypothetical protein